MGLDLYDRKQAAEALRVSVVTLDRLRQTGKLPYRQIGHKVRFTPEDLEECLRRAAGAGWIPQARERKDEALTGGITSAGSFRKPPALSNGNI